MFEKKKEEKKTADSEESKSSLGYAVITTNRPVQEWGNSRIKGHHKHRTTRALFTSYIIHAKSNTMGDWVFFFTQFFIKPQFFGSVW